MVDNRHARKKFSFGQFPGLSLVHGRSASTIELKRRGSRTSPIERPRVQLFSQRWNQVKSSNRLVKHTNTIKPEN